MDFPAILFLFFVLLALATPLQQEVVDPESPEPSRVAFKVSLFYGHRTTLHRRTRIIGGRGSLQAANQVKSLSGKVSLLKRAESPI